MEFSEWITKKYTDWRGDRTREISIAEFAKLFGAKHQVVSKWMKKGSNPPRNKNYIDALYRIYGEEVLAILGIQVVPSENINYDQLPPAIRSPFEAALADLNAAYATEGVSPDSPRALEIALSVLSKHGFSITNVSEISGDD